jgi:hypothetical protein
MRTLLRKTSTGLFFQEPGKWTEDPSKAFNFQSIDRALSFIRTWNLQETELAFGFQGQPFVKRVPLEKLTLRYSED